jgi:FixJ family two-component response regulator
MPLVPPTILIVDDDAGIRSGLERLLRTAGYHTITFASPREFLNHPSSEGTGCVILDLSLPEIGGLEVQERLAASEGAHPVIFLTGHGDVETSVRAMRAGAITFLTKPVDERALFAAVKEALVIDESRRRVRERRRTLESKLSALTPRERQVLDRVVVGHLNKQIAAALGTVEKTVKVHRARAMQKMGARSVAELVQMMADAGAGPPVSQREASSGSH